MVPLRGHLTGLDHSDDCAAIMFATLRPGEIKRQLAADDVAELSERYPLLFDALAFEPQRRQ